MALKLPYRWRPYLANFVNGFRDNSIWLHSSGTLPSTLIIGAQKAGTTSLFDALSQHDDIAVSKMKEVHFADRNWRRGLNWYKKCFPQNANYTIEATPNYLFMPFAAERMLQAVPEVRCIAILRDPVERAYSHYRYEYKRGGEHLSFEDALASEYKRSEMDWADAQIQQGYWSFSLQHHSYLRRGLYSSHLERWEAVMPKERLLVIEDRDLYKNTGNTLERIQKFIGITPDPDLRLNHMNANRCTIAKPKTFDCLYEYFQADAKALKRRYGPQFSWFDKYGY